MNTMSTMSQLSDVTIAKFLGMPPNNCGGEGGFHWGRAGAGGGGSLAEWNRQDVCTGTKYEREEKCSSQRVYCKSIDMIDVQ